MNESYEMIYILRPSLSEEQVNQEVNKYRDFLNEYNVKDLQVKIWGKRRLAYPIKRFIDGIYVQMNYQGEGNQVAPLERAMRLSEEVIRYMTLKVETAVSETPASVPEVLVPEPVEEPTPVAAEA
ncbi:ribosomal protein S6 [Rippkaea orientalis PCC 8801]|uniref:Small ribosomal subunit protein bS6 n=1 Tax=Rippkaea orientalis (strain PCC 8801 / RF-1) TaxID=41431 RepID=RS6_RIPO1|nr:30S ribosomal protein S6 [Rippkaea orientalis]B7JXP0.1 RecName: Full=Small ribosomal subunit protein bS6; AltName: Full=30S ribosomal protein S6 [Rippkaea orientalis PCC 8801]ACK64797.1 ribosomal protein S6 [Rippkaea orientalis PCC 8801]